MQEFAEERTELRAGRSRLRTAARAAASLGLVIIALASSNAAASDGPKITGTYGGGGETFTLATESPGELGLLKALATKFARRTPATLQWVKAGSGAGLDYLKNRAVDAVMVHAPAAERAAVDQGWAVKRTLIGVGATPGRHVAARFVDFVASDDGQQIIREYGRDAYGDALYQDAAYAESYVD